MQIDGTVNNTVHQQIQEPARKIKHKTNIFRIIQTKTQSTTIFHLYLLDLNKSEHNTVY